MKQIATLFTLALLLTAAAVTAQERYKDPVFTEVTSNLDVYGSNFTVLNWSYPASATGYARLSACWRY